MHIKKRLKGIKRFVNAPPKLVGIVNITPDSFSDGGLAYTPELAVARAKILLTDGADIIELGAEATGPGAKPVSEDEEIRRLAPVLKELNGVAVISIDTYKAGVAAYCLEHGASLINDVSGLRADNDLARVVAQHGASVVVMHSKEEGGHPHVSSSTRVYRNIIEEIKNFLLERTAFALSMGVRKSKIIIDPGMGRFLSENPEDSWDVLRRLRELVNIGFPVLIGTSRKGFLTNGQKRTLEERDALSQLSAILAWEHGATYVRTHNVSMFKTFLETWGKCR